jgi:pectin methylesterase-like acyl-CoA thioesterase
MINMNPSRFIRPRSTIRLGCGLVGLCCLIGAFKVAAALNATNLWPANGATNVCPDTPLRLTFDAPPRVNSSGLIGLYRDDGLLVDSFDLAATAQTRVINGFTFTNYAVLTNGNTATIFPHPAVLTNGRTYYVNLDSNVFNHAVNGAFPGIATTNTWRFTTKPSPPPSGSTNLIVAADGSADFCTVQGAVDFVPWGNTNRHQIFIRKGVYQEIMFVTNKHKLTLLGEDRKQTILTYANNEYLNYNGLKTNRFRAVLWLSGDDCALANLTVSNGTPKGNNGNPAQAETLMLNAPRAIAHRVDFASFQDTLRLDGSIYLQDCYVQGDTDFIWGTGTACFTNCELKAMNQGHNTQARTFETTYGEIFVDCRFTKASSFTGHNLGRAITSSNLQSTNGNVAYINCRMDTHISAVGWTSASGLPTDRLRYWEYQSVMLDGVTPVVTNSRASFSRQISAAEAAQMRDPAIVFGLITNGQPAGGGWIPQLAPYFTNQPVATNVNSGQTATFSAGATGIPQPTCQWLKNGTNLPGATNATLVITNARFADSGVYSVIASNRAGTAASSDAIFTVNVRLAFGGPTVADSNFAVSGSGGMEGENYYVLAASNAVLPLTNWARLATNLFTAGGHFAFTSAITAGASQQFYRLQWP